MLNRSCTAGLISCIMSCCDFSLKFMKCRSPTVTQCRNRAPNLEATCEKGACETFSGVNMARGKNCKWCSERHHMWFHWQCSSGCPWRCQGALTEQQFLSNLSTGGDTLLMERIWPLQRTSSVRQQQLLLKEEEGEGKKQSTAPQKPRSHFVILREAISPALHPATAYSLTLHWGESERGLHLSAFIWAKCRYAATELW